MLHLDRKGTSTSEEYHGYMLWHVYIRTKILCGAIEIVIIKNIIYGVCIVNSKWHFDKLMLFEILFRILLNKFVLLFF